MAPSDDGNVQPPAGLSDSESCEPEIPEIEEKIEDEEPEFKEEIEEAYEEPEFKEEIEEAYEEPEFKEGIEEAHEEPEFKEEIEEAYEGIKDEEAEAEAEAEEGIEIEEVVEEEEVEREVKEAEPEEVFEIEEVVEEAEEMEHLVLNVPDSASLEVETKIVDKRGFTRVCKPYIVLIALVANFSYLTSALLAGILNHVAAYLEKEYNDTKWPSLISPVVGAAAASWFLDNWGRKSGIMLSNLVTLCGVVTMAVKPSNLVIIIGRAAAGIGLGFASVAAPLYIAEAAPTRIRGSSVVLSGMLTALGQLISYFIAMKFTKVDSNWRSMVATTALPISIQLIAMCFIPESPIILYKQGKIQVVKKFLFKIYTAKDAEIELDILKKSAEAANQEESITGQSIFKKLKRVLHDADMLKAIFVGVVVELVKQFIGLNVVVYFFPRMVKVIGLSKGLALALPLLLDFLGSLIDVFAIDHYGRRKMLQLSLIMIILDLLCIGIIFVEIDGLGKSDKSQKIRLGKFMLGLLSSYLVAFSAGVGNLSSLLNAELYPQAYRGFGGGVSALIGWLGNLIISVSFTPLKDKLGSSGIVFLHFTLAIVGAIGIYFFVPETRLLSLEDVHGALKKMSWFGKKDVNQRRSYVQLTADFV